MIEWVKEHPGVMWWLAAASVVMFVGSLVLVPAVIVRMRADYFVGRRRPRGGRSKGWWSRHGAARVALKVGKNVLGVVLVAAGAVMLVLPGQGVLAVLAGVMLLDFPGKYRVERWLVSK